jgi:cell division protein FtsB
MEPRTTSTSGSVSKVLTVVVVVILVLSAYMAIEVSSLQGQVSSLQDQNAILQNQMSNMEQAQNYLQSQINRLLSAATQTKIFSFYVRDICVSVAPLCYSYPRQGSYVYAMGIVNNGTVTIPVTTSVYLEFKDATRSTLVAFNASLPQTIPPGGGVYLNSTSWPENTNATSKLAPGDDIGLAVLLGDVEFATETHVATCSSSTTTLQNYTSTQTETLTSCLY